MKKRESMAFYKAAVADILRASQRDETFVNEVGQDFVSMLKLFGNNVYNTHIRLVPILANCWYYVVTSLSNRQTLGEEYAGIIRVAPENKIPNKLVQFLWLILFVGGDTAYDRILEKLKNLTRESRSIDEKKKFAIYGSIEYFRSHKQMFIRLHRALFFIQGVYYTIPNALTGIRYILLRQWMQNETYTKSFDLLGKFSIIYVLYNLIKDIFKPKEIAPIVSKELVFSAKECALCGENRKNTSVTSCGHLFCWECIHDCLRHQNNCPICRDFIKPNKIILLQNYL